MFGVGRFSDFQHAGGDPDDRAFELLRTMTADDADIAAAMDAMPRGHGGDWPESQVEALYQTATGEGFGAHVPVYAGPGCLGAPCFRPDARQVVVLATDAPFHNGPPGTLADPYTGVWPEPHAWEDAVAALAVLRARVIGIFSAGGSEAAAARRDLESTAAATGALDPAGRPLVYDVAEDGTGITEAIVDGIAAAPVARFDVEAAVVDDPTDPFAVDAACFVRQIAPVTWFGPTGVEGDPAAVASMDASTFYATLPGSLLRFAVRLRNDGCHPGGNLRRAFLATIVLRADRLRLLDERIVVIAVPEA
jgi:hypothetical protein